jgi:hypothetical protein
VTAVPICLANQCAAAEPVELAADEDVLAAMYVRMWSLASGRRLPSGTEPGQLSVEELIDFWADDISPAPGRHVARDASTAGDAR